MKKIATDSVQSAILRDMIGVASADMYIDTNSILDAGTKDERHYLGALVGYSNIDYENMGKRGLIPAYSLDALVEVICRNGADCHFYHSEDDDHWFCRWTKCLAINFAAIGRIGKTKVDAAFEVVVSLYKEGYIKEEQ